MSVVMCHMSFVTCHLSPVRCQGPTPSSFTIVSDVYELATLRHQAKTKLFSSKLIAELQTYSKHLHIVS